MKWRTKKSKAANVKVWNMLPMGQHDYCVIRLSTAKWYGVLRKQSSKSDPWNWEVVPDAKVMLLSTHNDLRTAQAACLLLQATHNSGSQP
jgi:hypothetical protein